MRGVKSWYCIKVTCAVELESSVAAGHIDIFQGVCVWVCIIHTHTHTPWTHLGHTHTILFVEHIMPIRNLEMNES